MATQCMILIHGDDGTMASMNDAERGAMYGAYVAYNTALEMVGILRGQSYHGAVRRVRASKQWCAKHLARALSRPIDQRGRP